MWYHQSKTATLEEVIKLFAGESIEIKFPAYGDDGSFCASFWLNDIEHNIKNDLSGNWEIWKSRNY